MYPLYSWRRQHYVLGQFEYKALGDPDLYDYHILENGPDGLIFE